MSTKGKLDGVGKWFCGLGVGLLVLLGPGCASDDEVAVSRTALAGSAALANIAQLFQGPMSALLADQPPFRARAALELPGENVTGDLWVREGKFLFAVDHKAAGEKGKQAAGLSYLWDSTQRHGWVISDALQGYAPLAVDAAARVETKPGAERLPAGSIDGHMCAKTELVMIAADGSQTVFEVWLAEDLQALPLRISPAGAPHPKLQISKVRRQEPPADIFTPPDGFSPFASAEAMMNELVLRQALPKPNKPYQNPDLPLERRGVD